MQGAVYMLVLNWMVDVESQDPPANKKMFPF